MKTCHLLLVASMVLAGCASQTRFLDGKELLATMTAATHAQLELNCQDTIDTTVLSREVVLPPVYGPFGGVDRLAEYTIGVTGCGRKGVFVVICADGDTPCQATVAGGVHPWF